MDYIFIKSTKPGMEDYGTIYARVRVRKLNKKYSTGITLKEMEWLKYRSLQFNTAHVITSMGIKYGQLAHVLSQIKSAIEDDFDPDRASAVIRSIKASVINGGELQVKESKKKKILLVTYMEQYIENLKSGTRLKRGTTSRVSDGYIHGIEDLLKRIKRYELERRLCLALDDMTMDFQRDFLKWCNDNELRPNTINSTFSKLHTLLSIAYESKLTKVDDFRHSEFVPSGEIVDHIYLSKEQINQLLDFDLSSQEIIKEHIQNAKFKDKDRKKWLARITPHYVKQLDATRDEFIVGCLTGQRISDYKRINDDMLKTIGESEFIDLIQEKTGKKVIIPLDKRAKDILEKYEGKLPHINDRTFNHNIKFIGEIIGWTFKAKIDKERVGYKIGTRFCDMLGSHTARRTFASIAYSAGVPLSSIMAITGHSSEKTLRRYLKLQAEEKAVIAARDLHGIIQMNPGKSKKDKTTDDKGQDSNN